MQSAEMLQTWVTTRDNGSVPSGARVDSVRIAAKNRIGRSETGILPANDREEWLHSALR
jgi:hypothetical protein